MRAAALVALLTLGISLTGMVGLRAETRLACTETVAAQALRVSRLARLEAALVYEDAAHVAKEGDDWECDLACAASHRLRDELQADVRDGQRAVRACTKEVNDDGQ